MVADPGPTRRSDEADLDLSEARLRHRRSAKWSVPDEVLPAWIAETDFAPCPAVQDAVVEAASSGAYGYPRSERHSGVAAATEQVMAELFGWRVDAANIVTCGDVMTGVQLALGALCEDAPVVVPTPAYPPFLDVAGLTGRRMVTVPLDPDAARAELDLTAIDAALAGGARTVLLCQPHNPWGRVFDRTELAALADLVDRHGARVISDEVHAPLHRHGITHVPYASIAPGHTVTITSASKAWGVPGLRCAQMITTVPGDAARLRAVPHMSNNAMTPLGQIATVAAYSRGVSWVGVVRDRLDAQVALLSELLAERLPRTRVRPIEATYLAWLDARQEAPDDPAAHALDHGRVRVGDGRDFGPGGEGHVRVNLATSPDRLREIVRRLAAAWSSAPR